MNQNEFVRQFSHADVLLSQGRFLQAEAILDRLVATGYEENDLLRLLAITKLGLKKYKEAEEICKMIIARNPNDAFVFYLFASIKANERQFLGSLDYINQAISINPVNASFHSFKAEILNQTQNYGDALLSADNSLTLDAQNIHALNARATALVGLRRNDEAFNTIQKSLAEDPDNTDTHANMGWGLLHVGDSAKALSHFKIALQEDPNNQYAKAGMIEALKAKFIVYRFFLKSMLWLSKLNGKNKWAVIIGGYIVYRGLGSLSENVEWLRPFLIPIMVGIFLFFISTWIFSPLMNLFLLTNTYGRWTLSDKEKFSATLVGIALLVTVLALLTYVIVYENPGLLYTAIVSFCTMIPLGSMTLPILVSNQKKLTLVAYIQVFVSLVFSIAAIVTFDFSPTLSYIPLIILVAYQLYANYVLINE